MPSARVAEERPGVPDDLDDRYWTANTGVGGYMGGQSGQVGTTARLVLPPNEFALAADAGRVVSYAIDPDGAGFRPIVGPDGLEIIVRDVSTGETVRTINTKTFPAHGIVVGKLLYWAGPALPLDEDEPTDGGIQVIDLADTSSVPRLIDVPGSDSAAGLGSRYARQPFQVSASRSTLIAPIAGSADERTYVIDVNTQSLRAVLTGLGLGTTDETVLMVEDAWAPTAATRLRLIEVATGDEIGSVWKDLLKGEAPLQNTDILVYSVVSGEGELFVSLPRGQQEAVVAVISGSGEVHDILVQNGKPLWLIAEISSSKHLVLLPNYSLSISLDDDGRTIAALLDPVTGELERDVFTIGAP